MNVQMILKAPLIQGEYQLNVHPIPNTWNWPNAFLLFSLFHLIQFIRVVHGMLTRRHLFLSALNLFQLIQKEDFTRYMSLGTISPKVKLLNTIPTTLSIQKQKVRNPLNITCVSGKRFATLTLRDR